MLRTRLRCAGLLAQGLLGRALLGGGGAENGFGVMGGLPSTCRTTLFSPTWGACLLVDLRFQPRTPRRQEVEATLEEMPLLALSLPRRVNQMRPASLEGWQAAITQTRIQAPADLVLSLISTSPSQPTPVQSTGASLPGRQARTRRRARLRSPRRPERFPQRPAPTYRPRLRAPPRRRSLSAAPRRQQART